jgi:hypothetical protein
LTLVRRRSQTAGAAAAEPSAAPVPEPGKSAPTA